MDSQEPAPVVRTRSAARRRHLTSVATQLIQERGFESVSMNELSQAAGMSVGGLYRYIKTKTDVLVMACEDIYGDLRERLVDATQAHTSAEEGLAAAVSVYFESCLDFSDRILLMYREYRHLPADAQQRYMSQERAIADVFADLLRRGVRHEEFEPMDHLLLAHDIVLMGHLPALKGWALRGRDRRQLVSNQVDIALKLVSPRLQRV